jgi:hypothetical protein
LITYPTTGLTLLRRSGAVPQWPRMVMNHTGPWADAKGDGRQNTSWRI